MQGDHEARTVAAALRAAAVAERAAEVAEHAAAAAGKAKAAADAAQKAAEGTSLFVVMGFVLYSVVNFGKFKAYWTEQA